MIVIVKRVVVMMIAMMVMLIIVISDDSDSNYDRDDDVDDSHVIVMHLSVLLFVGKCWSASELRRPPSRRLSMDDVRPSIQQFITYLLQHVSSCHHMLICSVPCFPFASSVIVYFFGLCTLD